MSTSSASLCALAALAACNNLLGLDPALSDDDRDGIADAVDNCPLDSNPQQRDSDGNGLGDVCDCSTSGIDEDHDGADDACDDCIGEAIGVDSGNDGIDDGCETCAAATGSDVDGDAIDDACDACTLGPPHDEDGDDIDDACDNCPTQANPNQSAAACDRGVSGAQRFDPLVEQDPTLWPGTVAGWTWADDALTATGMTSRATLTELNESSGYLVETRASTTTSVSLGCTSISSVVTCTLNEATRKLTVVDVFGLGGGLPPPPVIATSGPLPTTGAVRFQLRVDPSVPSTSCEALDADGAVIAQATIDESITCRRFKVGSVGTSRLDYVWIVGE